MQPWRGAKRLGEKFLTLTLRHSGDVRRDIRGLVRSWRRFLRLIQKHVEVELGGISQLVWARVLEVTAGHDLLGHAHLHAWCLWPYIPHELLRAYWGLALQLDGYQSETRPLSCVLEEAGPTRAEQLGRLLVVRRGRGVQPLDPVPWPVLDIRECGAEIGQELVKYLIKDAERTQDGGLDLIDPALFARIYEGMEGVRTVQTSLGFWVRLGRDAKPKCCVKCGAPSLVAKTKRRAQAEPPCGSGP